MYDPFPKPILHFFFFSTWHFPARIHTCCCLAGERCSLTASKSQKSLSGCNISSKSGPDFAKCPDFVLGIDQLKKTIHPFFGCTKFQHLFNKHFFGTRKRISFETCFPQPFFDREVTLPFAFRRAASSTKRLHKLLPSNPKDFTQPWNTNFEKT